MKFLDFFFMCLWCVWFMFVVFVFCFCGLRLEGGVDWVVRYFVLEEVNKVVNIMKEIMVNFFG